MRKFIIAVAATACLLTSPVWARRPFTPPPIPEGYAEAGPLPENINAQIAAGLRRVLNDPYSVRDFSVCAPRMWEPIAPPVAGMDWEPARYVVLFALNARNSMGGYVGQRGGIARFRNGRLYEIVVLTYGPTRECPAVADEEIQRLIAAR